MTLGTRTMSHSDKEASLKPPAIKKMKQQQDASSGSEEPPAPVYSIIHGSYIYSEIDSFSFLVPAPDANRVLAALVQSTKQHHTWTIVPDEQIDAELLSKIPACLAHPVGTLPESFPEMMIQTEEELLDLILTGQAGLIAKKYVILYIVDGKRPEYKSLLPIEVAANNDEQQVQHAAEKLSETYYKEYYRSEGLYISHVSVWNHSEFQINIAGLRNQPDFHDYKIMGSYQIMGSLKSTDAWVTRLVSVTFDQVHDLLRDAGV